MDIKEVNTNDTNWQKSYPWPDVFIYNIEDLEPFIWPTPITETHLLEPFLWPEVISIFIKITEENTNSLSNRSDPKFRLYNVGRSSFHFKKSKSNQNFFKQKSLDTKQCLMKNKFPTNVLMESMGNIVKNLRIAFDSNPSRDKSGKSNKFMHPVLRHLDGYWTWKDFPYSYVKWRIRNIENIKLDSKCKNKSNGIDVRPIENKPNETEEVKKVKNPDNCNLTINIQSKSQLYVSDHQKMTEKYVKTVLPKSSQFMDPSVISDFNQPQSFQHSEISQNEKKIQNKTDNRRFSLKTQHSMPSFIFRQNQKVNHNSQICLQSSTSGQQYQSKSHNIHSKRPDQQIHHLDNQNRPYFFHMPPPPPSSTSLQCMDSSVQQNIPRQESSGPISHVSFYHMPQHKDQRNYIPMPGRFPFNPQTPSLQGLYQNQQFCNSYFPSKAQAINFSYTQIQNRRRNDPRNPPNCQRELPIHLSYFPQQFQMAQKNQQQQRFPFLPQSSSLLSSTNQKLYYQTFQSSTNFNSDPRYQSKQDLATTSCSNFRSNYRSPAVKSDLSAKFQPATVKSEILLVPDSEAKSKHVRSCITPQLSTSDTVLTAPCNNPNQTQLEGQWYATQNFNPSFYQIPRHEYLPNQNFSYIPQIHYGQPSMLQFTQSHISYPHIQQHMKTNAARTYHCPQKAENNIQTEKQNSGIANQEKNIPVLIRKRKMKKPFRRPWQIPNSRHKIQVINCKIENQENEEKFESKDKNIENVPKPESNNSKIKNTGMNDLKIITRVKKET